MKTLILCAANVCRSPAAEVLWRHAAAERGFEHAVASAGLRARSGQLPSSVMSSLLLSRGVVLPERGAVPFHRALACRHELILVMEPAQQQQLLALAPELTGRVHLLGRWGQGPVRDPTGGPAEAYTYCLEQMATAVDAWLDRLTAPASRPMARPSRVAVAAHA